MLAGKAPKDLADLKFPVIASPKLDGIRAMIVNGKLVSRTFKPIPNTYISKILERLCPEGIDGELIVGDTFQKTTSAVMKKGDVPCDFIYHVFDWCLPPGPKNGAGSLGGFEFRFQRLQEWASATVSAGFVEVVEHHRLDSLEGVLDAEERYLAAGYEGVMVRDPSGPYKMGRSTTREGYLLKIKRFLDNEAVIYALEEQEENTNEAEKDAFGRTKRSSAKVGKIGKDTLGKFLVRGINGQFEGVDFAIGTGEGLTQELRQEIWNDQDDYIGRIVKYRHQPHGAKDKPRLPIFTGFRAKEDM
jgi:DNA ligase-1